MVAEEKCIANFLFSVFLDPASDLFMARLGELHIKKPTEGSHSRGLGLKVKNLGKVIKTKLKATWTSLPPASPPASLPLLTLCLPAFSFLQPCSAAGFSPLFLGRSTVSLLCPSSFLFLSIFPVRLSFLLASSSLCPFSFSPSSVYLLCPSSAPWYNGNGWLGVKHPVTYLLAYINPCLCVCWPDDAEVQDYHIAYMSFALAFSDISQKFTSTPRLQFSPCIVTGNQ